MMCEIENLYTSTGIRAPSAEAPVAPLAQLMVQLNYRQFAVSNLTVSTAMSHLRDRGLDVHLEGDEKLAGLIYVHSGQPCIFVEKRDPLVRRRFSIGHEVGHACLHVPEMDRGDRLLITDPHKEDDDDGNVAENGAIVMMRSNAAQLLSSPAKETEADQFSAELLMPAKVVHALIAAHPSHLHITDLTWRLANQFLVSMSAMRRRLADLEVG